MEVRPRRGRFGFESPEDGLAFWERSNPPHSALRSLLPEDAYRNVLLSLARLFEELNVADGGRLAVEWDYVEVLARRGAD